MNCGRFLHYLSGIGGVPDLRESVAEFFTRTSAAAATNRYLVRKNALPHDIALNLEEILSVWGDGSPDKVEIARAWYRDRRQGLEHSWESFTRSQSGRQAPRRLRYFQAQYRHIPIPPWRNTPP